MMQNYDICKISPSSLKIEIIYIYITIIMYLEILQSTKNAKKTEINKPHL